MTDIALKVKVGMAACALAASASLVPMTAAQAAPVLAPAAPVQFTDGPILGSGGAFDLAFLLNHDGPAAPSLPRLTGHTWVFHVFVARLLSLLHCYHGVA
jgi:hypothetical protein